MSQQPMKPRWAMPWDLQIASNFVHHGTDTDTPVKVYLAAAVDALLAEGKQDAQLLTDLLAILQRHCGERGQSEGAVETLERLERELAAGVNYENESLEQPSPLKIVPSTASDGTGEA